MFTLTQEIDTLTTNERALLKAVTQQALYWWYDGRNPERMRDAWAFVIDMEQERGNDVIETIGQGS